MGLRDFLKQKIDKRRAAGNPGKRRTRAPGGRESRASLPTAPDADGYRAVAWSKAIPEGRAGTYGLDGDIVAVFRVEGKLFAIDNTCVHEDGPIGEGTLDGFTVACPYHDWRYDVRSGACLTDTSRAVACFDVREVDGAIWVGRRRGQSSAARGGEHDDGLTVM